MEIHGETNANSDLHYRSIFSFESNEITFEHDRKNNRKLRRFPWN